MFFMPYYLFGDQEHYRLFYKIISTYDLLEGFVAYRNYLGANDPVYYILVYGLSNHIEKDLLFSIVNGFFGFYVSRNLLNLKISPFILYPFLINFYFVVLLLAAERLKVSLLFFSIALISTKEFKHYLFIFLSSLAHLQTLLLVYVLKYRIIKNEIIKNFIRGNTFKLLVIFAVVITFFLIIFVMREYLMDKVNSYSEKGGWSNIIKPMMFCLLTIYYAKNKWYEIFSVFFPLIISSFLIGEERIVIFCYMVFLYHALKINKGFNFGVILTHIYFGYKGIDFLINTINNGSGFDNIYI